MIKRHYEQVEKDLNDATLCIVSKKRSEQEILEYYALGRRVFGENHAQELCAKAQALPNDIQWHFIGHLQRNKVRQILPYVAMIQSVDSLRLAKEIEKEAARIDKTVDVLVEVHMAEEDMEKSGASPEEARSIVSYCASQPHLCCKGIMAMGPHTDDTERIREVFQKTYALYHSLSQEFNLSVLSMGMSDDYRIALSCGSNMVRIGTYLFEDTDAQ